jgi:integrase
VRTREHIPVEDLQRLFASEVFTQGARPRAGKGEAAYWLPLLALFSGARLEELGQMTVQDVKRTTDGIDYFEVTDQGDGQRLKTKGSRRAVPIHPELIRLGLLSYIEEREAAGDARVFPLLRKDTHGKWTSGWSQWWARYRRSVGVDRRWHDMHALRHTFKRQCRECGIPRDIHDALTGHHSGAVGDSYGGQYPIKPLWEAIKKLRYDGLVLPAPAVEHAVTHLVAV